MRKERKILLMLIPIIFILMIVVVWPGICSKQNVMDKEMAISNMKLSRKEDKVGANIKLLQAIHGETGIDYRYAVDTDCPKWNFHTKYVTDKPITWVDESSAVEVIIYDDRITLDGTVYASGQYYTVPVLGGISSETGTLTEWENTLFEQAYQAYVSNAGVENRNLFMVAMIIIFVVVVVVIGLLMVCGTLKFLSDKRGASKVLTSPYTWQEIEKKRDKDNYVTGCIMISLGEIIGTNFEGFLNLISMRLVNDLFLTNIDYHVVGVKDGKIILDVSGCISNLAEKEKDELAKEQNEQQDW